MKYLNRGVIMKKYFLIIFILVIQIPIIYGDLQNENNIIKPYTPENFNSEYENNPFMLTFYNYVMHNYSDVIYFYDKGILPEISVNDFAMHYNFFIGDIIDVLIDMNRFNDALYRIDRWTSISDSLGIRTDDMFKMISQALCYLKLKNYNDYTALKKEINENDILYKNTISSKQDFFTYKWFFTILSIEGETDYPTIGKVNTQIGRGLELSFFESKVLANRDKSIAINSLEEALDEFEEGDYSLYQCFISKIERVYMFLAYLYYKIGDNENAMKNFKLALTKEEGSTFMGDWDYWLNFRDYYQDEYEVLLKLKEIYLEQQNN